MPPYSFSYVGKFQPRAARLREMGETARRFTNVYIKNFADELDKDGLEKLFSKFGKITSAAVMTDADGKSKGFGFVAFENPEDAEKVIFGYFFWNCNNSSLRLPSSLRNRGSDREDSVSYN